MNRFYHAPQAGGLRGHANTKPWASLLLLVALLSVQQGCLKPEEADKWTAQSTVGSSNDGNRAKDDLRYGFQQGEQYVYEVEIRAEYDHATESLGGLVRYLVKSADNFEIGLDQSGALRLRADDQLRRTPPRAPFRPSYTPSFTPPFTDPFPRPQIPGLQSLELESTLTIDRQGQVLDNRSHIELPYLFGNLAMVAIEPLAADKPEWSDDRSLEAGKRIVDGGLMLSGIRDRMQSPANPIVPHSMFVTSGTEQTKYRRADSSKDAVKIDKHFELHGQVVDELGPLDLDVVGDGYVVFDLRDRVLSKGRMSHLVTLSVPNTTTRVPLVLTFNRLSKEELAERDRKAAEARAAYKAHREELHRPLDPEKTKVLIENLKDRTNRIRALNDLATATPNEMRPEVAQALEKLLNEAKEHFERHQTVRALAQWATKDNIPTLVALAESEDTLARISIIDALGKLPDERCAAALAKLLAMPPHRHAASKALRELGPVAEDYVLPYLDSEDMMMRSEACEILAVVGTEKSIPKLKVIGHDASGFDGFRARDAIEKISSRK